jgi:hypothetical protein
MIMTDIDFAYSKGLQLGDRLVRDKGVFSKHHGIYVGVHNNIPLVAECQAQKGVQYVALCDFLLRDGNFLKRIEKFSGTEYARTQIIPRINQLLGTQYDLINFNCEHFAELIQTGTAKSKQVSNTVAGIGLGVLIFGLLGGFE